MKCNESLQTTKQWKIRNCSIENCSNEIVVDSSISLIRSEIYFPSRSLSFGIYEFEFVVQITKYSTWKNSSFAYVEISSSGITANLVQLGTSMITSGQRQDLKLDPGQYSIDRDGFALNSSVCFHF